MKFSLLTNSYFKDLLQLLLFLILIVIILPLSPKMPAPGLDASWALGLNQAVAQGLAFGKDILFTLGPYSCIYTQAYHPATYGMMMGGSFYLVCSYWVSLYLLTKKIPWYWTVILGIALLGMLYARDSLFFAYPLLAGLVSFQQVLRLPVQKNEALWITVLFAPFGLLPLIKVSLLLLCLLVVMLCCWFFHAQKKNFLALICLISPMVSLCFFWVIAGQSLLNLPSYLFHSLSMASHFTSAMATKGNHTEILMYLLASACILSFLVIFRVPELRCTYPWKIFLFGLFFVFLFLSFKTGFTRAYGHAAIPSTSILIAALLLPTLSSSRLLIPLLFFCVYTASYIEGHYTQISIKNNVVSTCASAWYGLKNRIQEKEGLRKNFDLILDFLKNQASFPTLQGKVDIYSYYQTYLIASQMNWSPRPVFQSYSVFTAKLAEKNKKHLQSAQRPDHIIFSIQPIDQRMPSLEDGASWPLLLTLYQPNPRIKPTLESTFLFLSKKNQGESAILTVLSKQRQLVGKGVPLPDTQKLLFAEIQFKPTLLGLLATFFFKIEPPQMRIELKNGEKKQYPIPSNMAKSEFLISPLIENTQEFALLYDNSHRLDAKRMKTLTLHLNKPWQWNKEYKITFKIRPVPDRK